MKILSIYVAFSENVNFNIEYALKTIVLIYMFFIFKKYVHILNFHNLTDAVLEKSVPMCIYSATNMALGSINILGNSSHLFFCIFCEIKVLTI